MQNKMILLVTAAAVVFISGYWLQRTGKPYGTALLTVHKLVALAAVIAIGLLVQAAGRITALSALETITVVSAAILVIAMFVSGGFIGALATAPAWVLWLHKLLPYFTAALVAVAVYQTLGRG
ncbi:MAG: hypothetical protein ABIA75_04925 [Candidatus Neomarinimicrobiota bacterium]